MQIKKDTNVKTAPCKKCGIEVKKGIRDCPHCGVLNPTLNIKEIVLMIGAILVISYVLIKVFE